MRWPCARVLYVASSCVACKHMKYFIIIKYDKLIAALCLKSSSVPEALCSMIQSILEVTVRGSKVSWRSQLGDPKYPGGHS